MKFREKTDDQIKDFIMGRTQKVEETELAFHAKLQEMSREEPELIAKTVNEVLVPSLHKIMIKAQTGEDYAADMILFIYQYQAIQKIYNSEKTLELLMPRRV